MAALITGAGAAGLAIAYISRETLTNFLGAVILAADKPFKIGDHIRYDNLDGIVEEVGMRSSRIRSDRDTTYCVPNQILAEAVIENISRRGHIQYIFSVPLVYETPVKKIEETIRILHEITDNFQGPDADRYKPQINLTELGAWSVNIEVEMWFKTDDFDTADILKQAIHLEILERLQTAGVSLAYPTSLQYWKSADAPVKTQKTRERKVSVDSEKSATD